MNIKHNSIPLTLLFIVHGYMNNRFHLICFSLRSVSLFCVIESSLQCLVCESLRLVVLLTLIKIKVAVLKSMCY